MAEQLDKKTLGKIVDIILENGGTLRRELFEYPYNEFESRDLIAKAEKAAKRIVKVIESAKPKN